MSQRHFAPTPLPAAPCPAPAALLLLPGLPAPGDDWSCRCRAGTQGVACHAAGERRRGGRDRPRHHHPADQAGRNARGELRATAGVLGGLAAARRRSRKQPRDGRVIATFAWLPWDRGEGDPRAKVDSGAGEADEEEVEEVDADHVRLDNRTEAELVVRLFLSGDAPPFAKTTELRIPPLSREDVRFRPGGVKFAVRRKDVAWMFVLKAQTWMTFQNVGGDEAAYAPGVDGGVVRIADLLCCPKDRRATAATAFDSREVLPGLLYLSLPRNAWDVDFQVGTVLRAVDAPVSIKVVRDKGADWRGRAMARVRVVDGGWSRGKYFSPGTMFLATLLPSQQVAEEIVSAHRALLGILGAPWHIVRLEGALTMTCGARLLLREDFGQPMAAYFREGGRASAQDLDYCATDLLLGLSAMHDAGLHHLTLSPDTVHLKRDGLGRLRLKIANLGASEQRAQPLPRGYLPPRQVRAPEIVNASRFAALASLAADQAANKKPGEDHTPRSLVLPTLGEIAPLPQPPSGSTVSAEDKPTDTAQVRALIEELPYFSQFDAASRQALARSFEGPFSVAAGRLLFRRSEIGDFLYLIIAGEVVSKRGLVAAKRYGRGDIVGDLSLLGRVPTRRLYSAESMGGPADGNCVVLRLSYEAFQKDLKAKGLLAGLTAPARRRYLRKATSPLPDLKAADVFAAGAVWCEMVTGMRGGPVEWLRSVGDVDQLRSRVSSVVFGGYYFALEERRVVALVTLVISRATPREALQYLQSHDETAATAAASGEAGEAHDPHARPEGGGLAEAPAQRGRFFQGLTAMFSQAQDAVKSSVAAGPASEVALDALLVSSRAREGITEQWERSVNKLTERYGREIGTILGGIYGQLFAKDLWWLFREPLRTPRYPVQIVNKAEEGDVFARWTIGSSLVFERQLRQRTLPRVVPSIRPAFTAGFEVGAAIGRNKAINFKRLWLDAFLGSFAGLIRARLRILLSRFRGSAVRWDDVGGMLTDAVARGRTARRRVLLKFGRLPIALDDKAPQVLKFLPSQWVPDIGLPLATGVGRRFFPELWKSWRRDKRKRHVRPKFETWDVDDVPQALRDFAEAQGVQQADLVAAAIGDQVGRGAGLWLGSAVGTAWALMALVCGHDPAPGRTGQQGTEVAGGYLEDRDELLEMERYLA